MKFRASLLLSATLLGLATSAAAQEADTGGDAELSPTYTNLPRLPLSPQIIYQMLLAEIAANRSELPLAVAAYLDLARSTRDPRIAKRAAEVALYARRQEEALQATQIWIDVEPASPTARQMMVSLLLAANRTGDLAAQIGALLALEKDNPGPALLSVGRLLGRLPDRAAAQRLGEQITEPYLKLPEAHFVRAQTALAAGDDARASAEIRRALDLRPDWGHAVLLQAQLAKQDPEAAAELLRRFLAAHPQAREVRLGYARTLVAAKRYDDARREFRSLQEDRAEDPDVIYAIAILSLRLNDRRVAEEQFKHLLEIGHSESNAIRIQLGQLAEEDKNWPEALRWYDDVTAGEQYVTAQSRAAAALAQLGRLDEARRRLRDAAVSDPQDREQFLIAEAVLLRDAGRIGEAYDVLEAALAENADQIDLLYEAALLADRLGHLDVVERNLRRAIRLKPDYAQAYNALGYSLADRNLRLEEAQQLIDRALDLAPDDPFILDSKGWVLFRRGDHPGALGVLQQAFALRPDPEIAAHIGEVLWSLGRRAEAEKTWKDAAQANPGNEALTAIMKKFMP